MTTTHFGPGLDFTATATYQSPRVAATIDNDPELPDARSPTTSCQASSAVHDDDQSLTSLENVAIFPCVSNKSHKPKAD